MSSNLERKLALSRDNLNVSILDPNSVHSILKVVKKDDIALTLLAKVSINNNVRLLYLKIFHQKSRKGLINEVISYLLLKGLEYPCADIAAIIQLNPKQLKGILRSPKNNIRDSSNPIAFACSEIVGDQYSLLAKANSNILSKTLKKELLKNDFLHKIAAFDYWVANVDRNIGNIILTPNKGSIAFDHSHSFTSKNWEASDLIADALYDNKLVEMMNWGSIDKKDLNKIQMQLNIFYPALGDIINDVKFWINVLITDNEEEKRALLDFIQYRARNIKHLFNSKFGLLDI